MAAGGYIGSRHRFSRCGAGGGGGGARCGGTGGRWDVMLVRFGAGGGGEVVCGFVGVGWGCVSLRAWLVRALGEWGEGGYGLLLLDDECGGAALGIWKRSRGMDVEDWGVEV